MEGDMRISKLIPILTLICLTAFASGAAAQDLGAPDTVKIGGGPLVVGQSRPLSLTIVNDHELDCYNLGFVITSPVQGFARFDSIVYVNRMADPSVMSFRIEVPRDTNGISPDSIHLGAMQYLGNYLPPGDDAVLLIYFTGLTPTTMTIDSGFFPPANQFALIPPSSYSFIPQFEGLTVQITEGSPPPILTLPESAYQVAAGTEISFEVSGESTGDPPVSLDFISLTGYDDETQMPENSPDFGSTNPAEFVWQTSAADIGIWSATFRACNSAGACVTRSVNIQVVSSSAYLVSFSHTDSPCNMLASTLTHGNFDNDPTSEALLGGAGVGSGITFVLNDPDETGHYTPVYEINDMGNVFALQTGFFDSDENLDAIAMAFTEGALYRIMVYHGDGDNSFLAVDTMTAGHLTRYGTIGEFTGDNYLDFAVTWHQAIYIFAGNGQGDFSFAKDFSVPGEITSINTADFDDDGSDDFAVGTENGVTIYLQTSPGVFTQSFSYSQVYGSLDIEVTNQGSDFNDDGLFDLCISTPSVGGTSSNMMVYLGNGDGSFDQTTVRTVKGQIFGNSVADFNGDGELDIAYVNGAREYAAILFGDGDGSFTNELRYPIPQSNPQLIDCYDVDLDGDVDIVIQANEILNGRLHLLRNELNPSGYSAHTVSIAAHDNAEIELTSSSGKVFNRVRKTMPSGEYYLRNLESDGYLDDYATTQVVENGEYTLSVAPKPNLPTIQPFTVEYFVDGERLRLADEAPMRSAGYQFKVSLNETSAINPRSGSFVQANPPSFTWPGSGDFDFQLATDIAFSDVIISTVVSGNTFAVDAPLPETDTTIYYWRIKPHGTPDFDCLYAINLVPGGATCGDVTGNGYVDIGDAIYIINYIFKEGPAPDPYSNGDVNGDLAVNIGDAVYYINYIFRGGPAPSCP